MPLGGTFPASARRAGLVSLVWALALLFPAPGRAAGPADPLEVEAFFNGLISAQMRAHRIPGAVAVVINDNRVVLAKGWGLADLQRGIPFDPGSSPFQTGSLSKLFTDTAVMQLHEQGRLDLSADVNSYLAETGFQVPAAFPQPVTAAHLLTHTAGFELRLESLLAPSPEEVEPLAVWLSGHRRARVRPPGRLAAYTNYAQTLAGYLVEVVSGTPFQDYVERNIFQPLGMTDSTIRQPFPPRLAGRMTVGNVLRRGRFQPLEPETPQVVPAAGVAATALDLARFMTALLQGGRGEKGRILAEETVRLMLKRHFSHDPRLSGLTYGFSEFLTNGQRVLVHRGYMSGVSCIMALIPEERVGFLAAFNCETAYWARYDILPAFLDHYYPAPMARPRPLPDHRERVRRFSGYYLPTSAVGSTFQTVLTPLYTARLQATPEGTLLIGWERRTRPQEFIEVEPLVFQELGGRDRMIFHQTPGGWIDRMAMNSQASIAFLRLARHQTPPFQGGLLASALVLFLSALVAWPILAWKGRTRPGPRSLGPRLARWTAGLAAALFLAFLGGMLLGLLNLHQFAYGITPFLKAVLSLPYPGAGLALLALAFCALAWVRGYWGWKGRVHYTLLALAGAAFVWWLRFWKIL